MIRYDLIPSTLINMNGHYQSLLAENHLLQLFESLSKTEDGFTQP